VGVYDRWHRTRTAPGDKRCAEHDLVPSGSHGTGDRWQVRWRDEAGTQKKRNFARKTGKNPEIHADAFDARTQAALDDGSYIDPAAGSITFRKFAEDWRKNRPHDPNTARRVELQLRLHVYPAIGDRTMRELGKRPSLTQAWIAGIRLAPPSALQVIRDVSAIYIAAAEDGVISRNPLASKSVVRPEIRDRRAAQTWTLAQLDALAAGLPARHQIIPYLGSGTGQRQGEMFGLAIDDEDPDVDFLRRVIHVRRQVRLVGGTLCFSPVKNSKPHDVPLGDSLIPVLSEHIRLYPPAEVTLPWLEPDGGLVTHRLILTRPGGLAMHRDRADDDWKAALIAAGLVPPRRKEDRRWPPPGNGMHRLRHTAASAWLSAGVSIAAVAEWLGDTVATVQVIYAHMMPGDASAGRRAVDAFFRSGAPDVPSAMPGDS
jgi:integrase